MMSMQTYRPLITRRHIVRGAALGAAAFAITPSRALLTAAAAQSARDLTSLGYPELKIAITDTGYEGVPAETAAGRYLLTLTGKTTDPGATAEFVSGTPLGWSAEKTIQFASSAGENEQIPLEFYQMWYAGGANVDPGTSAHAVIDLKPGEWAINGEDGPQQPAAFKVTGDFPADIADPKEDTTATLIDFAISFAGQPTAGKHLLKVQNHGSEPHFLMIMKGPDSMDKAQVEASLMSDMAGTPVPGALTDSDLQPVFFSPTQSIGTTTWHPVEIQAGTYVAICFFPTAGTGVPHAMNGMYEIFKISE